MATSETGCSLVHDPVEEEAIIIQGLPVLIVTGIICIGKHPTTVMAVGDQPNLWLLTPNVDTLTTQSCCLTASKLLNWYQWMPLTYHAGTPVQRLKSDDNHDKLPGFMFVLN
eukprot:g48000.t1